MKHLKKGRKLLLFLLILAAALAACYIIVSLVFQKRFLPNTTVNGIDVSIQTADEAENILKSEADDYTLTIMERGEKTETIASADIGLEISFGDTLDRLLQEQNSFAWPVRLIRSESLQADKAVSYEEERFETVTSALDCLDETAMTDSANAALTDYDPEKGYELIPAVYGTRLDSTAVKALIGTAIKNLDSVLDLEENGCYTDPSYNEESEQAQNMLAKANQYVGTTITYTFGDNQEVLDGSTISQWLTISDDLSVSIDSAKTEEYVSGLADKYNTAGKSKSLKSSYGTVVTVPGGSYGWKIDQSATVSALNGYLEAGENYTGDVSYSRTAASHGSNDYGNTYVEINLTGQHLWFYKNGSLVVESDFVSGNLAKGYDTPTGAYSITYKQKDATLRGQGYASPVSFWMPFKGGYGLHDASWRSKFGGTIYKTSGSHGCVNLPYSAAKKIYENISAGDPVLLYTLAGTEQVTQKNEKTTAAETQTTGTTQETQTQQGQDTQQQTDSQTQEDTQTQ